MRTAVLGAGSWGTTLALHLTRLGYTVKLWEFRPDAVRRMRMDGENKEFLPGHLFPEILTPTDDIREAVEDAEICFLVVPSHAVRETVKRIPDGLPSGCIMVSATKGIEQNTLMRMSEVVADVWKDKLERDLFVALTGPSHAEEVSIGLPTTVVAASTDLKTATFIQELFSSKRFRIYAIDDLVGAELGGSLKNVIAVAAGIADGVGFGDNVKGALMTRGVKEMSRLGRKLGGRPETFTGLSGVGDLITTCISRHSRNRNLGEAIGKGRKLKDVFSEMQQVAEGVRTTQSAWALAQREQVEMPITEQVYRILFEDADPLEATVELMTRRLKVED